MPCPNDALAHFFDAGLLRIIAIDDLGDAWSVCGKQRMQREWHADLQIE
jgi:hypothetical protein